MREPPALKARGGARSIALVNLGTRQRKTEEILMAHFEGQVRTQWLRHRGPDRKMRLLEDFVFVDDQNVRWEAPAGSTIDGASIP
jgi:hypothetical protein